MRELDRLDERYGLGADPRQYTRRTREHAPRWFGPVGAVSAVAAAVVLLLVLPGAAGDQLRRTLHLPEMRVLPTVEAPGHGTFAFERLQPGTDTPVSFSPCAPIHYVINPDGGPSGSVGVIKDAIAEASRRSGFEFAYDGTTSDRRFQRTSGPVLIGFADDDELASMAESGDAVGVGGSSFIDDGVRFRQYRTGMIALKASWFRQQHAYAREDLEKAVVMHELGHVLGLAHVEDRGELMFPSVTRTTYGPGDIAGLARLGAVYCAGTV
jgi:hypothetical protein